MNDTILELCTHIERAAQSVYIQGCDEIARSNMAQLMGICNAVQKIRSELAEKGENRND